MRHRVAGRKLGRSSEHRLALLRNLSTALFEREKITTTLSKAKELRPFAERLVTISKKETLHARRQVLRHIHDRAVVAKLFDSLSARYAERPGGYTRIIKLGPRRGDNAEMAIIELVDSELASPPPEPAAKSRRAKRAAAAGEDKGDSTPTKGKTTKKKTAVRRSKATAKKKAVKKADGGDEAPAAKGKTAKRKTTKKKTASRKKKSADE